MLNIFRALNREMYIPATLPDGSPWPKISIVTPSFNNAKYIEETIVSVLEQGYPNVEHIIVDGASQDGTSEILEKYKDVLAHVIQEPDTGQSNAINKGMRLTTGDIVTWLNSDDLLAPGALVSIAMAFHTSGADLVAGGLQLFEDGQIVGTHYTSCADGPLPAEEISDLYKWQTGKFFYQPEVMFTRELWLRAGGEVREDLHYSMDVEMWLRFAACGGKLHVIGSPVAMFRVHEDQKTNDLDASPDEYLPVGNVWRATQGLPPVPKQAPSEGQPPLKVAFVNDIGFQYGAGIAHKRLFKALRAAGHALEMYSTGFQSSREVFEAKAEEVMSKLHAFSPDLVVCGNLHCTIADSDILDRVATHWPTCFCIHDLWVLTGHCPHPGLFDCERHLEGCDHQCPSSDTYPAIDPSDIQPAWAAKRSVMGKDNFLALANSRWTKEQYDGCAPAGHEARLLRLGCDDTVFYPGSRKEARQELGLNEDAFIVLLPMVDFSSPFKGSIEGLDALVASGLENLQILCFGVIEDELLQRYPRLKAMGYLTSSHKIAATYRSADVVVSFSHAETYGQTLMESACCGVPVIAYRCTGLTDAVMEGVSGYLVEEKPEALIAKLAELYSNAALRADLGAWGSMHYKNERTLYSEYHSFHVNIDQSGILPAGRLNKNIFFHHLQAEFPPVEEMEEYIEKPSIIGVLKDKIRRMLPPFLWNVLRKYYRKLKRLR